LDPDERWGVAGWYSALLCYYVADTQLDYLSQSAVSRIFRADKINESFYWLNCQLVNLVVT